MFTIVIVFPIKLNSKCCLFTSPQDPAAPNRQIAIRIKYLPKGTVTFESILPTKYLGNIEKEAATAKTSGKFVITRVKLLSVVDFAVFKFNKT